MQFCTYLPAYLYFRTETKAVLVLKFTTLTSHPYTYITIGSDTLQCISSSPILPVCHLSLSYFSHISLHLSSHQSPPSLTILPLCNDSQYKPLFFFLMQTCLPLTFTAFLFSSFSHCSPSSFLPLYFLLHISIHHPAPHFLSLSLSLSFPLTPPINFPPSSFFMCCCIGLSLHSSILLKLSTQKT